MILNSSSEFGRLDISHLGMWLRLDDVPLPEGAQLSELVALTVRHQFSDLHREAVAAARSAEQRAALVGILTSVVHEARHFHDLLISPYGARLMQLNVQAGMAVLGALGSLTRAPAIIAPLSAWRAQLETLRLIDPDLTEPNEKLDELASILTGIGRYRRDLDQGIINTKTPFTTTSILESSAIITQLGAARRTFGLDAANELSKLVHDSPSSDRYFGALRFIAEQLGYIPLGGHIVMLLAALSGDVFSENGAALRSPVDVLVALTSWLSSTDTFPVKQPADRQEEALQLVVEIFERSAEFLARACGRDIGESMSFAWGVTSGVVADYERRLEGQGDDSIQWFRIRQLLQVYRNFRDVSARLMANFYSDPSYFLVDQYLDRLPYLLQTVIFFWSDYGWPATPELQKHFYIQQELIVPKPKQGDTELFAKLASSSYFDGEAFRIALVLASLDNRQLAVPDGLFKYALHLLDHESWLGYFDSTVPLMRLLMDGADARLPGIVLDQAVTSLELRGTKVYSGAGRIGTVGSTNLELLRRFDSRYPNWPLT